MADKDETEGAFQARSPDKPCGTCGRIERHAFWDPRPRVEDACYEDYGESCLGLGYERLKAEVRRLRAMLYAGCDDCHCTLVEWHHTTECPKWDAQGNDLPCTGKTAYCPPPEATNE